MPKLALAVWLLCAVTVGLVEYVTLVAPARDLAQSGIRTVARLECARGKDCHHTLPLVYAYVVNGKTYTASSTTGAKGGTHTSNSAPNVTAVTYSSTDPSRFTFGSADENYRDVLEQAVIILVVVATVVTACLYVYLANA